MDTGKRNALFSVPFALGIGGTAAYGLWIAAGQPAGTESLADWAYDGIFLMAALSCLARALAPSDLRAAWIAFGIGLLCWGVGDLYWTHVLADLPEIPYPSWADVGYLLTLPCFFVGIAALVKRRVGHFTIASWLDGTTAALAAAAVGTAFLAPALVGLTEGDPATVITNLAYPLGDLILLGFLVGALVMTGVRRAGTIVVVGLGLILWTGADGYFLYLEGTTGWLGGWPNLLWPVGALLIAGSASLTHSMRAMPRDVYRSPLLPPVISTLAVAIILVWDHFNRLHEASVALAVATLLAAVVRLVLSFRENDRLLHALHGESITDALTGLGNRRHLIDDLESRLNGLPGPEEASMFAMFDLDGFKSYNDSFGHPAGDALLERLGHNLRRAVGRGTAYRLGGDEFCVLTDPGLERPASIVETARAALSERGEGFSIGASAGWVLLPTEAESAAAALRVADQKMYAEKAERLSRSGQQSQDLLMRILSEREPSLVDHIDRVCRRALKLGNALSMEGDELETLGRAAQLHDIGKIAIPDDILQKPGPLDELEWRLMHRHTLIGERILGAAPGMKPIGALVRCSHERWDGFGYPDGLAGEQIPLGSRIIFIADAFDAMTSERPYQPAVTVQAALAEMRRCAGSQFDPGLIDSFCGVVEAERAAGNGQGPGSNGRKAGTNGHRTADQVRVRSQEAPPAHTGPGEDSQWTPPKRRKPVRAF